MTRIIIPPRIVEGMLRENAVPCTHACMHLRFSAFGLPPITSGPSPCVELDAVGAVGIGCRSLLTNLYLPLTNLTHAIRRNLGCFES